MKVTLQELRVEFFHLDYRDGLAPAYTAYVSVDSLVCADQVLCVRAGIARHSAACCRRQRCALFGFPAQIPRVPGGVTTKPSGGPG